VPVNVAIVGPAGSGKTTLFHALTAGRGADGVAMMPEVRRIENPARLHALLDKLWSNVSLDEFRGLLS